MKNKSISWLKWAVRVAGRVAFWLAWPLYVVYYKLGDRTRVLVVRDGEVLVVRNWVSDGKWSLPGGGLHAGETPLQGVVRELKEEIGLTVEPEQLRALGTGVYRAYGHTYDYHIFVMQVPDNIEIRKQLHEIADVAWMDPDLLNDRNAAPDALHAIDVWRRST